MDERDLDRSAEDERSADEQEVALAVARHKRAARTRANEIWSDEVENPRSATSGWTDADEQASFTLESAATRTILGE